MPEESKTDEPGKMFVGALAWNTTDQTLKDYFTKYGEVIETIVMTDKVTGRSRGFGFVSFRDPACVTAVLKEHTHFLDDRKIDPKPCTPKAVQTQKRNAAIGHVRSHKVFVGGIPREATEVDVRTYFEKFGTVAEVEFVTDKEEGRHKGFGFVTYEDAKSVDEVVDLHFHDIRGRKVEAKRAQPRDKLLTGNARPPHRESRFQQQPNEDVCMIGCGYGMPLGMSLGPSGGWVPTPGGYPMMNLSQGHMPPPSYIGYDYTTYPQGQSNHFHAGAVDRYTQSQSSYGPAKGHLDFETSCYGNGNFRDGGLKKSSGTQSYHPYRR